MGRSLAPSCSWHSRSVLPRAPLMSQTQVGTRNGTACDLLRRSVCHTVSLSIILIICQQHRGSTRAHRPTPPSSILEMQIELRSPIQIRRQVMLRHTAAFHTRRTALPCTVLILPRPSAVDALSWPQCTGRTAWRRAQSANCTNPPPRTSTGLDRASRSSGPSVAASHSDPSDYMLAMSWPRGCQTL